jgi:hypothetical protein
MAVFSMGWEYHVIIVRVIDDGFLSLLPSFHVHIHLFSFHGLYIFGVRQADRQEGVTPEIPLSLSS